MTSIAIFCTLMLIAGFMLYHRATLKGTTFTLFLSLFLLEFMDSGINVLLWLTLAIILIPLNLTELRSKYLSKPILKIFRQIMPSMSDTEKEALEAGTVWWEGELFRGKPHWQILHQYPTPSLSAEEHAFINGPVNEVCQMCDDWDIIHKRKDLPPEIWQYLKDNKFFAMIIPKEFGGLEFSAIAQSEILVRLNSVSGTLGSTVAVPNSLGPAELLLHYGTEEQKNYYLPRLASGEDIPCFALTNPEAGSDASSIPDYGYVVEEEVDGVKSLGIRLNFNKRYITLAPVASLIGLAFQLKDPDGLLGGDEDVGITCALIPRETEGVTIGRRHIPLATPFQNGPLQGDNVFITMDQIIGGQPMAGSGWRMLMDCLSAGRAISLPSAAAGGSLLGVASTTAYASIREQFKMPIGKMEGVEEFIARMTGNLYQVESARVMTAGSVDLGEKPSVPSAIVKYCLTERGRSILTDAMDVHGGKGIIMGPNNYLGQSYMGAPIGITVEGANILTRSLIVYGQGAIRCHPHIVAEMTAANAPTSPENLRLFDKAIFGHVGFVMSNTVRTIWLGLTGAKLVITPFRDETTVYYQRLTRLSAALAFCSDMAMFLLGGDLKRREKISGRFADLLSNLYIGSACLKRYDDQGRNKEDLPIVKLATEQAIYDAQIALSELLKNFPVKIAGGLLHRIVFPYGRSYERPSDALGHQVARLVMTPNEVRNRLVKSCFLDNSQPVGRLQTTLKMRFDAEPLLKKVKQSIEKSAISNNFVDMGKLALDSGAITEDEFKLLETLEARRLEVINVDDFDPSEV
jgi:acyl-CoA dehydrogenase